MSGLAFFLLGLVVGGFLTSWVLVLVVLLRATRKPTS